MGGMGHHRFVRAKFEMDVSLGDFFAPRIDEFPQAPSFDVLRHVVREVVRCVRALPQGVREEVGLAAQAGAHDGPLRMVTEEGSEARGTFKVEITERGSRSKKVAKDRKGWKHDQRPRHGFGVGVGNPRGRRSGAARRHHSTAREHAKYGH